MKHWLFELFAFSRIDFPYIKGMEEATSFLFCYGSSLFCIGAVCYSFCLCVAAKAFLWDLCTVSATAWCSPLLLVGKLELGFDEDTSSVGGFAVHGDGAEAAVV